jgi:hypothetical protein
VRILATYDGEKRARVVDIAKVPELSESYREWAEKLLTTNQSHTLH